MSELQCCVDRLSINVGEKNMSYHLKFRFVLAVLMGIGFAAMTPWMPHSTAMKHSHTQVAIAANFFVSKMSGFDGIKNDALVGTDTIVARSR
ncbi:hypothetical protein ELE36_05895 [Pseudolysobacter antarcticus]|uniref:Uncharacterized protein n=1 Tax=Pseudolysobacter antarcticus TaxID=2511995 RepID=A0A411HHH7_9GAMM|nr:hypothetical protein [Pseudolysobacter antarcticus]QBB69931.1 hypothetical protein ELE36_05895 [Pseudolysobacter antarcticus]